MTPFWERLTLTFWLFSILLQAPSEAGDFGVVVNGVWSDSATWTPTGGPPTASDNVYIGSGFPTPAIVPAAVQLDADVAAAFVSVGHGTLDLVGHSLSVNALVMDSANGPAIINKGGGNLELGLVLLFEGSVLTVDAEDSLAFSASVDGIGSILNLNRPLSLSDGVAVSDGSVVTTSAALETLGFGLQISGGTVNAGANISASSSFFGAGISTGGVLNLNGHTLTAGILYLGAGTYQVIGGGATLDRGMGGSVQLGSIDVNSGNSFVVEAADSLSDSIRVAGLGSSLILNRDLPISGSVTIEEQGALDVGSHLLATAASVSLLTGGQLLGNGEIQAPVQNVSGIVSPGSGLGQFSLVGDFEQQADGVLQIELGGTDNSDPLAVEFDQLIVDGMASLGGRLEVALVESYQPAGGDEFPIISATDGIQMTFDTETLPVLAAGLHWQVDLSDPQLFALRVVADFVAGDYNGNGIVDAADYTIWRDTLGQVGDEMAADGNQNGEVDQQDYELWKQNFGTMLDPGTGGVALSTSVPEPASALLIVIATASAMCLQIRARKPIRQFTGLINKAHYLSRDCKLSVPILVRE